MASHTTSNVAKQFLPSHTPPITSESYILDNAAGSGIVSALIKQQHPNARIKATDLAGNTLEVLLTKMKIDGWDNVETKVLDARELKTLENNTFTHVITNFGFGKDPTDSTGPSKAAKEMWRVLKPGGVAVVTTLYVELPFAR